MQHELILDTKYAGETLSIRLPDHEDEVYVNVTDADGNQVSIYLRRAEVKRLITFLNQIKY